MSKKKRKSYSREFKMEAVRLVTEKGYSMAEASRNLGIEYSVLRRWKKQLADDPQNAFPGKGKRKADDEELGHGGRLLLYKFLSHLFCCS